MAGSFAEATEHTMEHTTYDYTDYTPVTKRGWECGTFTSQIR